MASMLQCSSVACQHRHMQHSLVVPGRCVQVLSVVKVDAATDEWG